MTNWIKCGDRLPENPKNLLFFTNFYQTFIGWYHAESARWFRGNFGDSEQISSHEKAIYWMPLPDAPQDHILDSGKMVEEEG